MLPLLIVAGAALIGAIVGAASSSDDEEEVKTTPESDCHEEFLKFNDNLSIPPSKVNKLIEVRKVLQERIKEYFTNKSSTSFLGFYIQGSYKHGTAIRKQDDTCDVDLGVYFNGKPGIKPATIQNNIASIFHNDTNEKVILKNKCARIPYASQFHIDLTIYYRDAETNQYYLGTKTNGWEPSDSKLFSNWFREKTKQHVQIIRLIKYFKSWADAYKKRKGQTMPSGLAFTIWVINFYKPDERDDLALINTARQIYNHLQNTSKKNWKCEMPVQPHDNVIDKLDDEQKENFLKAMEELINSSEKVFSSESKDECMKAWKYLFGKWFPDHLTNEI